MKKLLLLFVILILSNSTLFSQGCLPEGIYFISQEEIDNFQSNYPGCVEIEGYVNINGTDITNLNGLGVLTSLGGNLTIAHNPELTNLTGLEGVISINGQLWIYNNPVLTNLTGLENLTTIGGALWISSNAFTNLTGLENLTSIGGDLFFYDNPSLTSLIGLDNLSSVGNDIKIGNYGWEGNNSLTSLNGLDHITSIGNSLIIVNNNSLISLSGLDNIEQETITSLIIHHNSSLSNCNIQSICDYLAAPNGIIEIYENNTGCNNAPEIANACGISFNCLPYGNYYFASQADIDNFQSYFPGCTELEGNVTINGNNITNVSGLSAINHIDGNFNIGAPQEGNPILTSLIGIQNLTSIGGNLHIEDNSSLISLTGLDNVSSLGGYLIIDYNNSLSSMIGLGSLTNIGLGLYLGTNASLTNLSGIEGLTSIGGFLSINNNNSLPNLTGLDNIDAGSIESLYIRYNNSLSTCEVQSICDYLASPNGTVEILDNAPGCNSPEEVQEACLTSVEESPLSEEITFFPNPGKDMLLISTPNGVAIEKVVIYNQTGQKVQQGKPVNNTLDISKLQQGLYIIELVTEQVNIRKKLLVE